MSQNYAVHQNTAGKKVTLKDLIGSGDKVMLVPLPFLIVGLILNILFPAWFMVGGPSMVLKIISIILLIPGVILWIWSVVLILIKVPQKQLITTGPYALMKHPIYTVVALLVLPWVGFLLNTWLGALVGIALYLGCRLFAHGEEETLSKAFGSAWEDYRQTGQIGDLVLPRDLQEAAPLVAPLFTPTTKAPQGKHDESIPFTTVQKLIGAAVSERVRDLSLSLYTHGREFAESRDLILADTKFEFGLYQGDVMLIDELFTPDSSRYWPRAGYQPGRPQPSFDKQFVRDYTTSLGWNRQPPGPELPVDIVENTRQRYLEAYHLLVDTWPQGV